MAIIKRGILGGFSNKIGNIVGSSWKGIAVMKSLPLSVANPRTTAQVNQRNKFSGCVALASALLGSTIKPLWDRFAQQQSGYNAFIQRNVSIFENDGTLIDWANLVVGEGKLGTVTSFDVQEFTPAGSIRLSNLVVQNSTFDLPSDVYYITAFDQLAQEVIYSGESGTVGSLTYTVLTTGLQPARDIAVYINRRSLDGTQVGNTGANEFNTGA